MELFRYRRFALGCGCFLVLLFASYYFHIAVKIATLVLIGVAFALIIILYAWKKTDFLLNLLIKSGSPLLFSALAMIVTLIAFTPSTLLEHCDNTEKEIYATVQEVNYKSTYISSFSVKVHSVGENKVNENAILLTYDNEIKRGDIINAKGVFSELTNDPIGFDEKGYYMSKGIRVSFEAIEFEVTGSKKTPIKDAFEYVNKFLDRRLMTIEDDDTYALLTALLLGNKDQLEDNVKRDFSRLGLSHILALSGMHITIVTTLLGFALSKLWLGKLFNNMILMLATLFFVGMTGFSSSAIRAGIMVCLVYLVSFLGGRVNTITALFISITVICVFDPYSIFSTSLLLSFFAMLGCAIALRFVQIGSLFSKIKNPLLRYLALSITTSVFAMIFTLPVIYIVFGNVAILSPISNIILSPIFTLLIYLAPAYIILSFIPFVRVIFGWFLEQIASCLLFTGEKAASLDHIVVPITNKIQIVGVLLITSFLFLFLVVKKRHSIAMLGGILCGIIIFFAGTGALYHNRNANVYAGAISRENGEILFVEEENTLTIFDINARSGAPYDLASHLGYYEIENYVVADYTTRTFSAVKDLSSRMILKRLYVPMPISKSEENDLWKLESLSKSKGFEVIVGVDKVELKNARLSCRLDKLDRSAKRTAAISITYQNTTLTYFSAATYELYKDYISQMACDTDILFLGAYGPKFKASYSYDVPSLNYCVFFNGSEAWANRDFLNSISEKCLTKSDYPYRFKLHPELHP